MKTKLLFIALNIIFIGSLFSQPTEEWERTYRSVNFNDAGKKVRIDRLGNIYTAASSNMTGDYSKVKCVLLKNSSAGSLMRSMLSFDSVYNDYLADMVVDQSGNCYVTGYTIIPGGYADYFTYKLNPDLSVAWRSVYAGPYGASDYARSIAVDANGNVYVTGSGYNNSPYSDFTTVKYNSSGVQQWAVSYDGPANSYDDAMSIAVDPQGNAVVTGTSYGGASTEYDIAIVKYGPSGNQLWVRRYNGPAYSDFAKALTVDASSDIYVTGYSSGVGTGYDYITMKYDPTGKQLWTQRYNGPANGHDYPYDIKVNGTGDVYVTGSSGGSNNESDFATVKYNSSGVLQWEQRFAGYANSTNYPNSMALDYKGAILLTGVYYSPQSGYDYIVFKYNPQGSLMWSASYNGSANSTDNAYSVAADSSGNVAITGLVTNNYTGQDIATIKYNSDGVRQWIQKYDGLNYYKDLFLEMNTDLQGNIYVVDYGDSKNYKMIKYNSSGSILWTQKYPAFTNNIDAVPHALSTIDKYGNFYVTALDESQTGHARILTTKINSSGVRQWVAVYGDTVNNNCEPSGISIDSSGNVLVSGSQSHQYNFLALKYSPTGVLQWANIDTNSNDDDQPRMAVDASGNIYITGGLPTYRIIKYNPLGVKIWENVYSVPWESWDGTSITLDPSGNIYVTRINGGLTNNHDLVVIKYNSSGSQLWIATHSGPGAMTHIINKLRIDNSGNIYAAGSNNYDYLITKFNSSGTELWSASYNGTGYYEDVCTDMTIDAAGNVFLTGGTPSYTLATTIKYNSSGVLQWADNRDLSASYFHYSKPELKLDPFGNLYVTDTKQIADYEVAGFLIKYPQVSNKPVLHNNKDNGSGSNLPRRYKLYDNYPNPFNPVTKINYDLPVNSLVNIVIYDILGKEVIKLVNNEYKEAGRYSEALDGTNLSSGVYFYRINANQFSETKKMVLVK